MAVGIQVFIGIRGDINITEPDHSDVRTVAPTFDECHQKIKDLGLEPMVPACRTLILKGRMRDR